MKFVLAIVLTLGCSGCLGGALTRMEHGFRYALQENAQSQSESLEALRDGQISQDEYAEETREATEARNTSLSETWEGFKSEAEAQKALVLDALKGGAASVAGAAATGGMSVLSQILATLGTLGVAGVGLAGAKKYQRFLISAVNTDRDARRKARDEPV